jgi:hypothetical protein
MGRFGLTPLREMTRYEKLSVLIAFLIFIGSLLPWYILVIESPSYFPGIYTTYGTVVMVLGLEATALMLMRRPVVEGVDNSTICAFMAFLVLSITLYGLRGAYFSFFVFNQLIEGFAGTGIYLCLVTSLLLMLLSLKVRVDRRTAGIGAFVSNTDVQPKTAPPVIEEKTGHAHAKKGFRSGISAIFSSRSVPEDVKGEMPKKEVPKDLGGPVPQAQVGSPGRPITTPVNTEARKDPPDRETMLRWLNRVTKDRKVFERCPRCNSYKFMDVKKKGDTVLFKCIECDSEYKLFL